MKISFYESLTLLTRLLLLQWYPPGESMYSVVLSYRKYFIGCHWVKMIKKHLNHQNPISKLCCIEHKFDGKDRGWATDLKQNQIDWDKREFKHSLHCLLQSCTQCTYCTLCTHCTHCPHCTHCTTRTYCNSLRDSLHFWLHSLFNSLYSLRTLSLFGLSSCT